MASFCAWGINLISDAINGLIPLESGLFCASVKSRQESRLQPRQTRPNPAKTSTLPSGLILSQGAQCII